MFVMLALLFQLLFIACFIAGLVFFVLVVVQMFKRNQSTLGIVCVVLTFCGGPLIAFVYGWIKATEWNLKKTMTYWSVTIVLQFVSIGLMMAFGFMSAAAMAPPEIDYDPNDVNIEIDMGELDDADFSFSDDFNMPEDVPEVEFTPAPEETSTDQP